MEAQLTGPNRIYASIPAHPDHNYRIFPGLQSLYSTIADHVR